MTSQPKRRLGYYTAAADCLSVTSLCCPGVITPLHRRQQIYNICRQHDVIIMEDDPYYYLQFSGDEATPQGFQNLGKSYLSLDTDGRVIRLDSFAKVRLVLSC